MCFTRTIVRLPLRRGQKSFFRQHTKPTSKARTETTTHKSEIKRIWETDNASSSSSSTGYNLLVLLAALGDDDAAMFSSGWSKSPRCLELLSGG